MAELATFISQVGFPIFVACVLLYQTYHMHSENNATLVKLTAEIAALRDELHRVVETFARRDRSRS